MGNLMPNVQGYNHSGSALGIIGRTVVMSICHLK